MANKDFPVWAWVILALIIAVAVVLGLVFGLSKSNKPASSAGPRLSKTTALPLAPVPPPSVQSVQIPSTPPARAPPAPTTPPALTAPAPTTPAPTAPTPTATKTTDSTDSVHDSDSDSDSQVGSPVIPPPVPISPSTAHFLFQTGAPDAKVCFATLYEELIDVETLTQAAKTLGETQNSVVQQLLSAPNGRATVQYYQLFGMGRRFAIGPSMQRLPSAQLRGAASSKNYYTLDMVNTWPTILSTFKYINRPDFPYLTALVKERATTTMQIKEEYACSDKAAKAMPLSFMNGLTIEDWAHKYSVDLHEKKMQLARGFFDEVVRAALIEEAADPAMLEKSKRHYKMSDWGIRTQPLQARITDIENRAISVIESAAALAGWRVDVLLYDGVMLRREGQSRDNVLALIPRLEESLERNLDVPLKIRLV